MSCSTQWVRSVILAQRPTVTISCTKRVGRDRLYGQSSARTRLSEAGDQRSADSVELRRYIAARCEPFKSVLCSEGANRRDFVSRESLGAKYANRPLSTTLSSFLD